MSEGNGNIPQEPGKNGNGKVGYKCPPVHTRFKPGNRANPGGRPKGATLLSEIHAELDRNGGKGRRESAKAYVGQMKRGSLPHAKEVIEREEGAVPSDGKVTVTIVHVRSDGSGNPN